MKNAILPQVSSNMYGFGYNEGLMGISNIDIPTQNLCESSFCMDDVEVVQNHHGGLGELFTIYSQSSIDDVSEILDCPPFDEESHSTSMPICDRYDRDNNISQMPMHLCKTLPVQESENGFQPIKNARKRSIDHKKYKKAMCFQGAIEGEKIQKQRVPLRSRRSQKLTDKITALQKLVSPYGKTDTASVLLEAYISIKLLQDQIQKLVHTPGEDKGVDLQRRGLSLVPFSFTHKFVDSNFHINTTPSYG